MFANVFTNFQITCNLIHIFNYKYSNAVSNYLLLTENYKIIFCKFISTMSNSLFKPNKLFSNVKYDPGLLINKTIID